MRIDRPPLIVLAGCRAHYRCWTRRRVGNFLYIRSPEDLKQIDPANCHVIILKSFVLNPVRHQIMEAMVSRGFTVPRRSEWK